MKRNLFDLIKSLNATEKKAIRTHAFIYRKEGGNILSKLFTLIDKQVKPDDKELQKRIPNLSNRKKELWDKIMLVLQMQETNIRAVNARRKLDFAHILISKQLFNQAASLIEEVRQYGIENEDPYITGMALNYQSAIAQHSDNNNIYSRTQAISKLLIDNAEIIVTMVKAYNFYIRVFENETSSNFIRDPAKQQKAVLFLSDKYIDLPMDKMGIMTASMYTDAKSSVYYILRDFKKSLVIENKMKELFNKCNMQSVSAITAYRNYLSNTINLLEHTNNLDEWAVSLTKNKKHIDTYFPNDLLANVTYYVSLVWYHYKFDKFKTAPKILSDAEEFYNKHYSTEIESSFLQLQWDFIIVFFDLGQLDKAWQYCYSFIENAKSDSLADVKEFMRIFFLFIILEKKEWNVLGVKIKQLEKSLRNQDKTLYAFDNAVIFFMKKMHSSQNTRAEQRKHLQFLLKELTQLKTSQNLYTLEVLHGFNFIAWIENKISSFGIAR